MDDKKIVVEVVPVNKPRVITVVVEVKTLTPKEWDEKNKTNAPRPPKQKASQ